MREADVFNMWIIQRRQLREEREQHEHMEDHYNMIQQWEAWERERLLYPHHITTPTQFVLREVGLLKFYREVTSLKGHNGLLGQLIYRWDDHRQAFWVGIG